MEAGKIFTLNSTHEHYYTKAQYYLNIKYFNIQDGLNQKCIQAGELWIWWGVYFCQISFKLAAGQCANMLQSFQCNGQLQRGHAAAAGGECCCAQHDAGHALHRHNLQHTEDFYLY